MTSVNLNNERYCSFSRSGFHGIFLFFLVLFASNVNGQTLDWYSLIEHATTTEDPNDRIASFDVVEDNEGNVLVCGGHRGTHDFDPGPAELVVVSGDKGAVNIYDIFITKYDPSGALAWVINIGGNDQNSHATSLDVDNEGNVYVTGKFDGTFDFDPGPDVYNLASMSGDGDMFVAKYDTDGNFIWAFVIEGTSTFRQSGFDLDVNDAAGRMVIGCRFDDPVDLAPGDPGTTVTFGTGGEDAGIVVYDLDGNFIYGFGYNDPSGGGWVAVEMDDDANVYAYLGVFFSCDVDPGPGSVSYSDRNAVIIKYDADGNYLWDKAVEGSVTVGAIELDPCDNIVVAGHLSSAAGSSYDFGDGEPEASYTGDGSSQSVYVAKYDSEGNFIWLNVGDNSGEGTTRLGSNAINGFQLGGLALDKDGDIYITGSSDADGLSFGALPVSATGWYGYVTKMDYNGAYQWTDALEATAWGLTWLMSITVGDDYDVSIFGKSSNEVSIPFGGGATGVTAQNAYSVNISQVITPPDPEIEITLPDGCASDTISFAIIDEIPDSAFWDFGDPPSGADNMGEGLDVFHIYGSEGTYDVQAILYFGCIPDTLDTTVTVNFDISLLELGPDTTICVGESLDLDATVEGAGTTSYSWSDGSTDPILTVSETGTYSVIVNADDCVLEDSIMVNVVPIPDTGEDSTAVLCYTYGDVFDLNDFVSAGVAPGGTWEEISDLPSGSFDPTTGILNTDDLAPGVYEFQLIMLGGVSCPSDTAEFTLDLNLAPDAGDDLSVTECNITGSSVNMNDISTATGGSWSETTSVPSGQFNNATGVLDLSDLAPGSYEFKYLISGEDVCPDDSAFITVVIIDFESAGNDVSSLWCEEEATLNLVDLLEDNSTAAGSWFEIGGGASGGIFDPADPSTNQFLFVVNEGTVCPDTAIISIEAGTLPEIVLKDSLTVCALETIAITSFIDGSDDILWSTGETGEFIYIQPEYDDIGTTVIYTVSAENICGVVDESISVYVEDCEIYIYVPNTFTPNGDSFNNTFEPQIFGIDEEGFTMQIFNRWGELLHTTNTIGNYWNGTNEEGFVEDGTYVWRLQYKNPRNDQKYEQFGHVLILK